MFKRTIFFTLLLVFTINTVGQISTWVYLNDNGKLEYKQDEKGNVIPDYSGVGYRNGEIDMPDVAVVKTINPISGDNYQQIQTAINQVAAMPLQPDGFRGAILLKSGTYEVSESINISTSGIVLRGEGESTHLVATGTTQYYLIKITSDVNLIEQSNTKKQITNDFVPVGAKSVNVEAGHTFWTGDWVHLRRVPNKKWLALLGMDVLSQSNSNSVDWDTITYTINYQRQITAVDGNLLTFDAPVIDVIDSNYAEGYVLKVTDNRINNCGVEDMKLSCTYTSSTDENHAWNGIWINSAAHCTIKNVAAYHFGFGCVSITSRASFITVDNCSMFDHISRLDGSKRYSFNVNGQRCLIKNCSTRQGRHDYAHGSAVAGPNVFYNCTAANQKNDIGPHQRWSTGTLFDNITGNGSMNVQNRMHSGTGHGWTGAQMLFWNCKAAKFILHDPPSYHKNWAIGCTGVITGWGEMKTEPLGIIESQNKPIIDIPSLFLAQLNERLESLPPVVDIGYYSQEETDKLKNDMEAGLYSTYELTTSGGNYVLTANGVSPMRPIKSFTLKAADGLAEKPILSYAYAVSTTTRYMFYPTTTITATFEGLAINGLNPIGLAPLGGQPNFFRSYTGQENTNVIVRDCYFYDFSSEGGVFRIGAAMTSIDVQRSTFKNCEGHIVYNQYRNLIYGDITLKNNTFSDITGAASLLYYADGSSGTNAYIDHCTMNNFNTSYDIFVFSPMSGTIEIKSSLFNNINGGFSFSNPVPTMNACYIDGFAIAPTGNISNSFTGTVPQYVDASTLNYGLTNKNAFICSDGLPVGNTIYYENPSDNNELRIPNEEVFRIVDGGMMISVLKSGIFEVINLYGVTIMRTNVVEHTNTYNSFSEKGVYILKLTSNEGTVFVKKVIF